MGPLLIPFTSRLGRVHFHVLLWLIICPPAMAHDTWVQTDKKVIHVGDAVCIDLMLGNHGNDHRDFQIAGRPDLAASILTMIGPNGERVDLKPAMAEAVASAKDGYFTGVFIAEQQGLHLVAQSQDKVVHYAPTRSVKSAKTFFLVIENRPRIPAAPTTVCPLGHALELVPLTHPVVGLGPGIATKVRLLFKGKPLANARVSFIPRGVDLAADFDPRYERITDKDGCAEFSPSDANLYLIVAHHAESEVGEGYTSVKYSATLTLDVPAAVCECCN